MLLQVLMIDDHPSQLIAYQSILSLNEFGYTFNFTTANSCESAYAVIVPPNNRIVFDIVLLDRNLPAYFEKRIMSGDDIGLLIKEHSPKTKILMLTANAEAFVLFDCVKTVKPEGLLVKSDFDGNLLLSVFKTILEGETFYSKTVNDALKMPLLKNGSLDEIDRKIITLLAQGFKLGTICLRLGYSESAIEKRKSKIKIYLGIDKCNDEQLIEVCRKQGLI